MGNRRYSRNRNKRDNKTNKANKTSIKIGDYELDNINWEDLEKEFYELADKFNYYSVLIATLTKQNKEIIDNDPKLKEVIDGFTFSLSDLVNKCLPIRDKHLREENGRFVSIRKGQVIEDNDVYEYISIINNYGILIQSLGDLVSKFWLGVLPTLKTKNNELVLDDLKEDIRTIRGEGNAE